jgi:hypothetical protein
METLIELSWPLYAQRFDPGAYCGRLHAEQLRCAGFAGNTPASGFEREQQVATLLLISTFIHASGISTDTEL